MPLELTERSVKAIAPPKAGAITVWDAKITGFGVRVFAPTRRRPQGARSFFLNYRIGGRERRFTIGEFPSWSTEAARNEAKELRRRIDRGEDPASQKRERREAPTVADLAERYRTVHLPKKAESSQANDWAMIEKEILPELGSRKVADVHHGDIEALHRKITADDRPVRANRVLAVCSKMFSLSLKPMEGEIEPWRDHAQGNPCKGVERNQEHGHERFFSQAELAALGDALAAHRTPASDCISFIMLTGCRPGEAMTADWEQFDEPGFWIKPAANTKQRKTHKVPLGPAALELLARIQASQGTTARSSLGNYVFPGQVYGQPLTNLHKAWKSVCAAAGISNARIYDLRHTFASVGAGGGLSLQIIGRLLGHTQFKTTLKYAHLADDPLREAAGKITAQIAGAGKSQAEVVQLPKRGGVA